MQTTLIQVGRIQGRAGALMIGYSPERDWVQLYASDPSDKRKSGVSLILTQSEYRHLKRLIEQLDQVIDGRTTPQPATKVREVTSVSDGKAMSIGTSHGKVVIQSATYEMALHIAQTKSLPEANTLLALSLPDTSAEAISEALNEMMKK